MRNGIILITAAFMFAVYAGIAKSAQAQIDNPARVGAAQSESPPKTDTDTYYESQENTPRLQQKIKPKENKPLKRRRHKAYA